MQAVFNSTSGRFHCLTHGSNRLTPQAKQQILCDFDACDVLPAFVAPAGGIISMGYSGKAEQSGYRGNVGGQLQGFYSLLGVIAESSQKSTLSQLPLDISLLRKRPVG